MNTILLTLALTAHKWQNMLNIVFILSTLPRGRQNLLLHLNRRIDRLPFVAKSVFCGLAIIETPLITQNVQKLYRKELGVHVECSLDITHCSK